MIEDLLPIANLVGAFNGGLLGVLLIFRNRRASSSGFFLGALLFVASVALALITAEHRGWLPAQWWVYAIEESLTLLSGPLLLSFTMLASGRQRPSVWVYAPVALHLLLALVLGPRLQYHVEIEHVIGIQMLYTLVAVFIFLTGTRIRRLAPAVSRTTGLILACMVAIHLAQVLRLLVSEPAWIRDIVPITGTAFFYLLLVWALFRSRLLNELPGARRRVDPVVFEAIERCMSLERPWSDPGLDLAALAACVGHPTDEVSRAINEGASCGFYEYIARYRIDEARRLLADPAERRYTIEGIARQCGFGSRSTFYKSFRNAIGMSPTEFRRNSAI